MANERTVLIPKEPPPPYTYTCQNATSSSYIAQSFPKPTFRQWLDSKMAEHDTILRRILASIMIATIVSSAIMLFLWRLQQLENNPEDGPPSKFPTHRPWSESTYSTSWFFFFLIHTPTTDINRSSRLATTISIHTPPRCVLPFCPYHSICNHFTFIHYSSIFILVSRS